MESNGPGIFRHAKPGVETVYSATKKLDDTLAACFVK